LSSNKGQLFTPDFIMATVIFLFILITLQVNNYAIREKISNEEDMLYYDSLISKTDILVLYPGYPKYWNGSNVEIIGFAEKPNVLNKTKIEAFVSMSDSNIKKLLNIEDKSFYFIIRDSNDNILYEKGSTSWQNSEKIFVVKRNVIIDEKGAEMRFIVYGD